MGRRVGRAQLRIGLHVQSLGHCDGFGNVEDEPTQVGRAWQLILVKSLPHGPDEWTRRRYCLPFASNRVLFVLGIDARPNPTRVAVA
jgi:hypothetical protein